MLNNDKKLSQGKVHKKFSINAFPKRVSVLLKPTKTISGVTPLAVMLPPKKCKHGACLYCPSLNAPQSYTPHSPAVLRASKLNYNPKDQINERLKQFHEMGHPTDKIELIIMGGTFLNFSEEFKEKFIKDCYDALNQKSSKNLEQAKKINETAQHRIIALCIETRPDFCSDKQIKYMLRWGTTRVELGVQAVDDKIYKFINRGHTVKDVIEATKRLKQAGFKIGYHLMPGLPLSNEKKDIQMFKEIFSSEKFKPDQIKIYPCQVLKGAKLVDLYYKKKFIPYTREQIEKILIKMITLTPEYCRIMRMMREIPQAYLIAGTTRIDLRKDVEELLRHKKTKIKEIRFREIGFALRDKREIDANIKIKLTKYKASEGTEYFIQAINKDNILFALIRLRLEKDKTIPAMIRELHVYGPEAILGENTKEIAKYQHKGLGKLLMQKAEEIAKKEKRKQILVISGVGVREYYKKLGYNLDKEKIYMEKDLD